MSNKIYTGKKLDLEWASALCEMIRYYNLNYITKNELIAFTEDFTDFTREDLAEFYEYCCDERL